MATIFDSLISARLDGTRFSFYNDEEIQQMSVKEIHNPMAYDELNNPTSHGICDESMGVSALDKLSKCKTCGCDSVNCPGHMGHIKLTSTCYNPFTMKLLHSLLKSKCLVCHRLRISPKRIELFEIRLKLIKLGYLVEAEKLSDFNHFSLESIDSAIRILRKPKGKTNKKEEKEDSEEVEEDKYAAKEALENLIQKEKENREIFYNHISSILQEDTPNGSIGNAITVAIRDITKEIMNSVVPSKCPHCDVCNPRIKKDGATKFFQMPLSNRDTKAMLSSHGRIDMRIDISTMGAISEYDEDDESSGESEVREGDEEQEKKQKYLSPIEVLEHMKRLWDVEDTLLNELFDNYTIFFMNNLLVSPNRFRPESSGGKQSGDDRDYLHAHSAMLTKIINANIAFRRTIELKENLTDDKNLETESEKSKTQQIDLSKTEITSKQVIKAWAELQESINCYLDSSLAAKLENKEKPGLRQLLERKEGIFRMKMMGKRVNFAGRSVISPDPYISTDQIGVPEFIARTITFPEPAKNIEKLKRCVINGAHKHPGANFIEYPNGERKALENMTLEERKAEAALLGSGGKIVYRHMQTGDPLLVNRQPTLHKPSIMAHNAIILPKEQTIRMHYSNCKSYNADFDGDEMNIHLPQNHMAIAEAYEIASTHRQYIVPTSGAPIRGLIQDFIISSVFLTSKDTFLCKEQYNQLIYASLCEFLDNKTIKRIHLEVPAFIKSKVGPRWTGKQVISTILKNLSFDERDYIDQYSSKALKLGINITSKSRLEGSSWGPLGSDESTIIIKNNELLQGILDKNQLGESKFGLVHSFYEVYGSKKAGQLLTALGRLFISYLQYSAFTCGVDDALLSKESLADREEIVRESHKMGIQAGAKFCGINIDYHSGDKIPKEHSSSKHSKHNIDDKEEKRIIHEIKKSIEKRFINEGMHIEKEFDSIVQSEMNDATTRIIDKCIPTGLVKDFPANNISSMVLTGAKGGKINRSQIVCLLGQQELEGRRVPRMPNGKTLPSFSAFDPHPRSSGYISDRFISGLKPQDFYFHCMAGREGLIDTAVKTSRSGYLQRCLIKQLESLVVSYDMTVRDNDGSIVQFLYGEDSIDVTEMLYLDKFDFLEQNYAALLKKYYSDKIMSNINTTSVADLRKQRKQNKKDGFKEIEEDPILSIYNPSRYLGSTSEKVFNDLKKFCKQYKKQSNKEQIVKSNTKKIKAGTLEKLYYLKYMKSLIHPGENVGTIAAQGIGEPSTQMTLNTFHLAGHGGANVTLGIPRLREILMTASETLKTPLMILPLRRDKEFTDSEINSFANKFQRLQLSEVIHSVKVNRDYILKGRSSVQTKYDITLEFEDLDKVYKTFSVTSADLNKVIVNQFLPLLMKHVSRQAKKGIEDTMIVKETKSKHMQSKEQAEDEELLEKYQDNDDKNEKDSVENSEIDQANAEIEGADAENAKRNIAQVEGYDQDDDIEKESEMSKESDMHNIEQLIEAEEAMNIDGFEENISQKSKSNEKIDSNPKNISSKSYPQYINFINQENEPEFKRAKMIITLNIQMEANKPKLSKLLMLSLVEAILQKVLIRSVKGINKSYVIDRKIPGSNNKEKIIQTEGINFEECYTVKAFVVTPSCNV